MLKEAWCALALAIVAPRFLYPEEAMEGIEVGKVPKRSLNVLVPEMLQLKQKGLLWREIAQMFDLSRKTAMQLASRWRKKK